MTTPMLSDLVTSAYMRLVAYAPFQQLVLDGFIGTDAADPASDAIKIAGSWVFQGLDNEGRPYRDPEGSSRSVVVLSERREWASPNSHNTAYFPALQMLIYTDSTRDPETGAPASADADRKCKHIFRILDRCFHLPSNHTPDRRWPLPPDALLSPNPKITYARVHSSLRGTPFSLGDVPLTQSTVVRGEATYNIITD